jgi:hypothetical protein
VPLHTSGGEDDEQAKCGQRIARKDDGQRHLRPGKATIQRRNQEQAAKGDRGEGLDDLLAAFALRGGTDIDPPLEELRIVTLVFRLAMTSRANTLR